MAVVGDYVDFQNGYAFKSNDFCENGDYNVIKIKELKDGKIKITSDTAMVKYMKDIEKYVVDDGDILFALTGDPISKPNPLSWVGRVSIYRGKESAVINQRVCKVIPKYGLSPLYLYYFFRNNSEFYQLAAKATGSASQANISTKTISDTYINLPNIEYQNKVVGILSSLDEKIEINNKINDNLEQQAFALFDSLFPAVSAGENSIGDYIIPKRGKNLLSKNAIFGDIPVVAGGLEPSTYHNVANTSSPVLTISASGANSGFVRLWDIPVWSSDSSYIDVTMTSHVYFWYVMLKKRQKEIYDSQTGSAQPHIYPQHIAVMPVVELNDEDVNSFTEQVTPLFRMIGANVKENNRLASVRDALLPRLMSGELDVSDINL